MIIDSLATGTAALPQFKEAFDFLKKLNVETPIGRIDISDRMYCNVMEYEASLPWAPCKLEAHKEYIDIQIVLSGAEDMAYRNVAGLEIADPYIAEKDVMFYQGTASGTTRLELIPGMFAVFFPNDGHYGKFVPSCGTNKICKAVLKFKIR